MLPWSDIPMWLSHECAHVIRYTEGDTAFARFIGGGNFAYGAAMSGVSLLEFLVDEGLATAVAGTYGGADDIPPRTGYYLGWRMVQRFLQQTGVGLADALRLPASAFIEP